MDIEESAEDADRFRAAFRQAPTAMALCTPHGDIQEANDEFAALLGRSVQDLAATSLLDLTHDADLRAAHSAIAQLRAGGIYRNRLAVRLGHADGSVVHAVVSASRVDDRRGAPRRLIVHIEDVTHRVELEAALHRQALHDPLTGLPNRTLFVQRLNQAADSRDGRVAPVAVLFMDLDRFKTINDTRGHAAGDAVPVAVAGRLRSLLRPGDTVTRFGGDEFVLLRQGVGMAEANTIAERTTTALRDEITVGSRLRLPITASIGIAVRGRHQDPLEWLI